MASRKAVIAVIAAPLLAAAGALILLDALNGPTDDGFRCRRPRAGDPGTCEILRSRLLGLGESSAETVPGSAVRGAQAVCGAGQVGRSQVSCSVYFVLDPGGKVLVLSYSLESQAQSAARRINAYLADPTALTLEIRDSVLMTVLVYFAKPLLVILLLIPPVLAVRRWRLSRQ